MIVFWSISKSIVRAIPVLLFDFVKPMAVLRAGCSCLVAPSDSRRTRKVFAHLFNSSSTNYFLLLLCYPCTGLAYVANYKGSTMGPLSVESE